MPTHYQGKPEEISALNAYITLMRAGEAINNRVHLTSPAIQKEGLTVGQIGVLEALLFLGPLNQKELAEKLLRSGGNMTMVLDNLEKRGLVTRSKLPGDRRTNVISLTRSGNTLISGVFPGHVQAIVSCLSALSPVEQEQLRGLCRKLGRAYGKT